MNTWTISKRLTGGFATVSLLVISLSFVFMFDLGRIDKNVTSLTKDSLPGLVLSSHAYEQLLSLRVVLMRQLASNDHTEILTLEEEAEAATQQAVTMLEEYESTIHAADDRENFARVSAAFRTYVELNQRLRGLIHEGRDDDAHALIRSDGAPAFNAIEREIVALVQWNEKAAHAGADAINDIMGSTRKLTLVLAGIAIAAAVAAGVLITRGVNKSIRRVVDSLNSGSEQVAAAATQVSSSSQSLAQGASEQAASLEETGASLEEVSSMTKRNADGAQQAKELSNQTRSAADNGAADMDEMKRAMAAIKASSDGISKIIKTIDEIAFQTNILALNAAVEAARAGEAGMGFAVVADEVRNLAQRSAQSAKETAEKIEEAIQKSEHGVNISNKVAHSLAEIVEKARKVDALVGEIANASTEQSQGIGQVNNAVCQMDQITQASAANAEETASAAEELNAQAVVMRENVAELMKLVGGSGIATSHPTPIHQPNPRHASSRQMTATTPATAPSRRNDSTPSHSRFSFTAGASAKRAHAEPEHALN